MVISPTKQVRFTGVCALICGKPAAEDTVDSAVLIQPLAPVAVAVNVPAFPTVAQLAATGVPLMFHTTEVVGATVAQISAVLTLQVNSALVTAMVGAVTSSVISIVALDVQPLEGSVT